MDFDRITLRNDLASLAARGVYLGTSSWKYLGWLGQVYSPARYEFRGKVATTRFERDCLREYAELFTSVCVDAAYYTFPTSKYLDGLARQVPDGFKFSFKVTDLVTVKHFPNIDRFGERAGYPNPDFLNAELFKTAFLGPLEKIRDKVGVLMFEFSRFDSTDFPSLSHFIALLDPFLAKLPSGWHFGIELRNRKWLTPEYFACLSRHKVTHVFNSWSAMPDLGEQMALPGSVSNPKVVAGRLLVAPGRTYEASVKAFQPYDHSQEANESVREAAAQLLFESLREQRNGTYLYVNNRLEGNAPNTIAAISSRLKVIQSASL